MKIKPKRITEFQKEKIARLCIEPRARAESELNKIWATLFPKKKSVGDLSFQQAQKLILFLQSQPAAPAPQTAAPQTGNTE